MSKYGGWVIVIGGFFLAACLLAAVIVGTLTASTAGNAVDDAMLVAAASDDVSVSGTQRNTTVIMGLVNIGSGNTKQSSVTTTVQNKTAIRSFDDSPWLVILVMSLIVLIAVAVALLIFAPPHEGVA